MISLNVSFLHIKKFCSCIWAVFRLPSAQLCECVLKKANDNSEDNSMLVLNLIGDKMNCKRNTINNRVSSKSILCAKNKKIEFSENMKTKQNKNSVFHGTSLNRKITFI